MQNTPEFLSEKFKPASLPEVYAPRRALLADYHEAADYGFIYISAPAGSGKTVSSLLWLIDCNRKPIWIGLDEYDNALSVFYKLIATGLCSTQPDNENMRAVLEDTTFSASPVEHTVSLISEMRIDTTRRALVLDDMHLINNSEIAKSLPFVIKRLPKTFVTLILSRSELPESFSGLIKNEGQIISTNQLRFALDEIQNYFNSLGMFLTPDETLAAQAATDGWAIGVNAVAQSGDFSMKQDGIFAHFFRKYIWSNWDDSLRDFCLKTSVVSEFNSELAERLSGRRDSREVLESLCLSNNFISRLNNDTYRYHHLFIDFLCAERNEAEVSELYKVAANYYMEQKDYSMALRFWLDSGDYKGADKFLFLFMFGNHQGDIAGYVDFLRIYFMRDFPEKAFKDFPPLHVCCAWYYYMTSQFKEYEYHADEGYKNITQIAFYDPKFVEFAMLMYSVDHRSEMLDKVKRFGVFGKLVKLFSRDGIIRYIASFTHNLPFAHRSSFDYSEVLSTKENLDKIRRSAFMALLGDQHDEIIVLGLSGVSYERNELQKAFDLIRPLRERMDERNSIDLRVAARFLEHSILLNMNRSEDAKEALYALTDFVKTSAPFYLTNLEAYKVKLRLAECKLSARAWLDNYYVVDADCIELYLVFQHFTTVRAHMALGDGKNARRYLEMLREFGRNLNRTLDFCEASILLSALDWALGRESDAVAVLEPALEKLQKYNYKRLVINEGEAIIHVLKRLDKKANRSDYTGALNREFLLELILETHSYSKNHKSITGSIKREQKPVKLSAQQLNMLRLLGKGYTNAMIVEEIGIKISTVKTHTAIAYQKLGVNNVVDAVLKAREMGLIE